MLSTKTVMEECEITPRASRVLNHLSSVDMLRPIVITAGKSTKLLCVRRLVQRAKEVVSSQRFWR